MENRPGLCLDIALDDPNGKYESAAADKPPSCWNARTTVTACGPRHSLRSTVHVVYRYSILDTRDSILDTRRLKTKGYVISQRVRKRIEELLGWCKTVGGMARAWFIGRWKIRQQSEATAAAYNLLRMARLAPTG